MTVLAALFEMAGRVGRVVRDHQRGRLLETHVALLADHVERRVDTTHDRERLRRCATLARDGIAVSNAPRGG